jgi:WD40 repeat protein
MLRSIPRKALARHGDTVLGTHNGHTLATGSADRSVILWDVRDPTRPQRIGPPLTGHTGRVLSVAFAPDGRTLATGSADQSVILWDVRDPTRPQRIGPPLTDHTGSVFSVAFAPGGRTLATGSGDKSVILWDLTYLVFVRDHALQMACTRSGGGLSPDEWNRFTGNLPYEDSCSRP